MADQPKKRYYVLGSTAPFDEDLKHEFKGHQNLCVEEIPAHAWINEKKRSRQPISKCLNGYLNNGFGGTVYIGIKDNGQIKGLHLTQYTQDHMVAALSDLMGRYTPPVEPHRYKIRFVPAVEESATPEEIQHFVNYDASKDADEERRRRPHELRQSNYCWCHKDSVAQINNGVLFPSYVAEITIKPWDPTDSRNQNSIGKMKTFPLHQDECGKTYFRRQASLIQYTPQELMMVSKLVVQQHYESKAKQLKEELAELRRKVVGKKS